MAMAKIEPREGILISWSGGKDSALALFRTIDTYGKRPYALFTMMIEDGSRSRSHGIRREVLEAQAHALGLPISFFPCSWDTYEHIFEKALRSFQDSPTAPTDRVFNSVVFGDICLKDDENWNNHRTWADTLCARAGMQSLQPLWGESEEHLINDFFQRGLKAIIMCEKVGLPPLHHTEILPKEALTPQFLGKNFTRDLAKTFQASGISPCGERGEFHTFVFDGPIFQTPLKATINHQTIHQRSGYWHGEVDLE